MGRSSISGKRPPGAQCLMLHAQRAPRLIPVGPSASCRPARDLEPVETALLNARHPFFASTHYESHSTSFRICHSALPPSAKVDKKSKKSFPSASRNMNSFERPLCKAPRVAIATNFVLAIAFACLAYLFPRFAILCYGMASLFIACSVLFVVLLFVNPQTRIVISTAFGTFGISAAEQALVPEASGDS